MKQFTLCIVTMLLASHSFVKAGDETDLLQQTKGWDWLFTEKSENKKVSYPVETYYRIFENHPDYRVRGRFIYDKNGELKRVAYLLSKYYEKCNLNAVNSAMNSDYQQAFWGLYNDLSETIKSKMSQVVLPKKCLALPHYDVVETDRVDELNSPSENPLPKTIILYVSEVVRENKSNK